MFDYKLLVNENTQLLKIGQLCMNTLNLIKLLKFMFFKKATKIDEIFTIDSTVTTYRQIDSEDTVNFCGLLLENTWTSRSVW